MNKLRKKPPPSKLIPNSTNSRLVQPAEMSTPVALRQPITPPSQSRTMMFARASVDPSPHSAFPASTHSNIASTYAKSREQMTTSEQYWAARALTAETLLSANTTYQHELRMIAESEQTKRSQEIAALQQQHEQRHSKLERLAFLLLTWVIAMVAVLIYMLLKNHHVSVPLRWTTPLHFTIPVLSPFTSVVEHETSIVNARLLVIFALFVASTAYGCFRYWLNHHKR
ncbi:unnamed protein product [Somion occarium]|uniref:Uncharacterized protein n=2 Tax=Somion occarium TaxID=3059160 RepID=A0ABP1DT09_9APHY